MSGTVLWAMGEGLHFAERRRAHRLRSAWGSSATIHFLNRLRLESRPGVGSALAVERATVLVGPALILTTVVLACGLVVTVFSDLPVAAKRCSAGSAPSRWSWRFVADLFILRPTAVCG